MLTIITTIGQWSRLFVWPTAVVLMRVTGVAMTIVVRIASIEVLLLRWWSIATISARIASIEVLLLRWWSMAIASIEVLLLRWWSIATISARIASIEVLLLRRFVVIASIEVL